MNDRRLLTLIGALVIPFSFGINAQKPLDSELYDAIRFGRLNVVRDYISEGVDPNRILRATPMGDVALLKVAVYDREEEIALELIRLGADFRGSNTELGVVSSNGLTRLLDQLLGDVDFPFDPEPLNLKAPCQDGYYEVVATALAHGRRLAIDWRQVLDEAVVSAIAGGHDDIARLLLDNGANVSSDALVAAARGSSPGMVRYLIDLGADPLQRYVDPLAAFRESSYDQYAAIDFAYRRYRDGVALSREISPYVLFELMRAGSSIEDVNLEEIAIDGLEELDRYRLDPGEQLIRAARIGYYSVISQLIEAEIDGITLDAALIESLRYGNRDIARQLLEAGASPVGGALHLAATQHSAGMVRHLLASGADINERLDGRAPIEYWWSRDPDAAQDGPYAGGATMVLHELIVAGADVCWLRDHVDRLGLKGAILMTSAPECFSE